MGQEQLPTGAAVGGQVFADRSGDGERVSAVDDLDVEDAVSVEDAEIAGLVPLVPQPRHHRSRFAADVHPLDHAEAQVGQPKAEPVPDSVAGALEEAMVRESRQDPVGGRLVQAHRLGDLRRAQDGAVVVEAGQDSRGPLDGSDVVLGGILHGPGASAAAPPLMLGVARPVRTSSSRTRRRR